MANTKTEQNAIVQAVKAYEIVGVARKSGDFNGTVYDNMQFHTLISFEDGKGVGKKADVKKTKVTMLADVFEKPVTVDEVMQMVGKFVLFHYDEYGNVNLVREVKA
jgi:hypothetical protein